MGGSEGQARTIEERIIININIFLASFSVMTLICIKRTYICMRIYKPQGQKEFLVVIARRGFFSSLGIIAPFWLHRRVLENNCHSTGVAKPENRCCCAAHSSFVPNLIQKLPLCCLIEGSPLVLFFIFLPIVHFGTETCAAKEKYRQILCHSACFCTSIISNRITIEFIYSNILTNKKNCTFFCFLTNSASHFQIACKGVFFYLKFALKEIIGTKT
jgi:hypothetical protein